MTLSKSYEGVVRATEESAPLPAYGGKLVHLMVEPERALDLERASRSWVSWTLNERQICDLELLITGALSPLEGFMCSEDYEEVCERMRLADGTLWPIPIGLEVDEETARRLRPGAPLVLRDLEGMVIAVMDVADVWRQDREREAELVFGTTDPTHPGVEYLHRISGGWCVGGRVEATSLPAHYDFRSLRLTPAEVRERIAEAGWSRVVGFQTRNPVHRVHYEITRRAMERIDGALLFHPAIGRTRPGDVDHYTRVRCYSAVFARYPADQAMLSLLPLAMRMAGPREALWHGIIRRNYGCTHFIVGRDHAGASSSETGLPFHGEYEACELFERHHEELGIKPVPFEALAFDEQSDTYVPVSQIQPGTARACLVSARIRSAPRVVPTTTTMVKMSKCNARPAACREDAVAGAFRAAAYAAPA